MNTPKRLASLDALRGFDMLFIMGFAPFVMAVCGLFEGGFWEGLAAQMEHVEWNGLAHHDTIFPLFLFIAGISFPFSLASMRSKGLTDKKIYLRIARRAVTLVLLGFVYNGFFKLDFENFRLASVLGRIGVAWGVAALLQMLFSTRTRVVIAGSVLVVYGLVSQFVAAPDAVAGADPLSLEGCLAGWIDRCLLPGRMYLGSMDPEGIFSTIPAVVTAMLGMLTGEFIRLPEERFSGRKKASMMALAGVAFGVVGALWSIALPINKTLWSSTFVCVLACYSLLLFALFYYIIDVRGWQKWCLPLRVIGLNSITIYMAQAIFDFNGLTRYFFGGVARICGDDWRQVIMTGGYLLISWLFLWFLYRKKIFLKV